MTLLLMMRMIQMISSQVRSSTEVGTHLPIQKSTLILKDLLTKKMVTLKEVAEVAETMVMHHNPGEINEMVKKKDKASSSRCFPQSLATKETIHPT